MKTFMTTQLVTRDQFEIFQKEYWEEVEVVTDKKVQNAIAPVQQEVTSLASRVIVLENAADFQRDPNDPALRRIAVLGIESKDAEARISAIEEWFKANLPNVRSMNVANFYRRNPMNPKKFEISTASYVEFSDFAHREIAFDKLSGKSQLKIEGKTVDMKRALTKEANARNNALKDAEKALKGDARVSGAVIKREFGNNERGVTVNGVYAFSQGSKGPGVFQQPFVDLKLPDRRGRRP